MIADKIFDIKDKQNAPNTRMIIEGLYNKSMIQIKIESTDFQHDPVSSCDYIQLTPNDVLCLADAIHKYLRG